MLRNEKQQAFRNENMDEYKLARQKLNKAIRAAKIDYKVKMEAQFNGCDSSAAWKSLKNLTNYKKKPPQVAPSVKLANELNVFYTRFELPSIDGPQPLPPAPPSPEPDERQTPLEPAAGQSQHQAAPLSIEEKDVLRLFTRQNVRKAGGPDGISPATLKHCARQLAPVFTGIFNESLAQCKVPACFKSSTIIPIPKKDRITGLNDYRPVALTSVAMKCFEKTSCCLLKTHH